MIPEALAAVASLAITGEKIASTSNAVERQKLLLEFLKGQNHAQQIISGLLAEKAALAANVDELKQALLDEKDWKAEASQYELRQVGHGVFAQVRKGDEGAGAAMQKYCPACFGKKTKSILQQFNPREFRDIGLRCNTCGAEMLFHGYLNT